MTRTRYHGSAAWKALRLKCLERDRWRCQICGGRADIADHITSLRNGGMNVLSNLRSLCPRCDRSIKERAGGQRSRGGIAPGCDAQGRPIDKGHWWNHDL